MDKLARFRSLDDAAVRWVESRGADAQEGLQRCRDLQRRIAELGVGVSLVHLLQDQGLVNETEAARIAAAASGGATTIASDPPSRAAATPTSPRPAGPTDPTVRDFGPPAALRDSPGRIGDYRIVRELGRGGMGVVYEAVQEPLGRRVAVKVLQSLVPDEDGIARFRREAAAAARLAHPNVVRVYGAGDADGLYYYAMEYVDGKSLAAIAAERPIPPDEAARIVVQAAYGLHYAHENGVVHRDVKPANLMITTAGNVVITDFGLVRDEKAGPITVTGEILGTPRYMSPEQAEGRGAAIDRRTDVYALGACLYELLCGKPVFDGASMAQVLHKVLVADPVPPRRMADGVPRDLETICLKALSKERERRYPTALAFQEDVERWRHGDPILARPLGPLSRLFRRVRRQPVAAGAFAAAFLVAAVALGAAWSQRARAQARATALNHASSAFAQGRVEEALQEVGGLLRRFPDDPDACLARARMLVRLGRWDEARADFDRCEAVVPSRWEPVLERGLTRVRRGERAAGLADLRAAEALAPDEPAVRIAVAEVLADAGDLEGARTRLAGLAVAELPANLARAHAVAQAHLLLAEGKGNPADGPFATLTTEWPDDPAVLETVGRAALERGEAEEARRAFLRALEAEPHDPRAMAGAAEACILLLDPRQARAELDLALREAPGWHRLYELRARVSSDEEAIEQARRAIELEPGDDVARLLLARLLVVRGAAAEAQELTREGRTPELGCVRAAALAALGRADDARRVLDEVLASCPGFPEAHARRAQLVLAAGEREAAARDFAAALAHRDRAPRAANLARGLARSLMEPLERTGELLQRGARREALKSAAGHLVRAARADPTDGPTLAALGDCLLDQLRCQDAASVYRRALAANPLTSSSYYGLGFLLVDVRDLRDLKAARELIESGSGWLPEDARLRDLAGTVAAREGDDDEALAAYTQALEIDPELAPAWRHLATLRKRLERGAGAAEDGRWRAARPDRARAARLLNTAHLARREDQPQLAQVLATRALEEDPRCAAAYVERAEAAVALMRIEQAMMDYMRALELDARLGVRVQCESLRLMQKFPMGVQILAHQVEGLTDKLEDEAAFHLLRAYVDLLGKGDLDSAERYIGRVLELNPDFVLARTFHGLVALQRGRWEEAERHLTEALQREPEAGLTHYYLACCHAQRGNIERGVEHLEAAFRLGFDDYPAVVAAEKLLRPLRGNVRFDELTRVR